MSIRGHIYASDYATMDFCFVSSLARYHKYGSFFFNVASILNGDPYICISCTYVTMRIVKMYIEYPYRKHAPCESTSIQHKFEMKFWNERAVYGYGLP